MWVLDTIDITIRKTTPAQELIAYVVIALLFGATIYFTYRTYYTGLQDSLKRHKAAMTGEVASTQFESVYLSAAEAADEERVRGVVRDILEGNTEDQATVGGALGTVKRELASTWAVYLGQLPTLAQRALGLAVVVTVLGMVAVSTEVLIGLLETSGTGVRPVRWASLAGSETLAAITRTGGLLSSIPVVNVLWALLIVLLFSGGVFLYTHYWLLALVLVAGAVALTLVRRELPYEPDVREGVSLPDPYRVGRVAAAVMGGLWLIMLLLIGIGRETGGPATGVRYGAYALLGVLLAVLCLGLTVVVLNRGRVRRWWTHVRAATTTQRAFIVVLGVTTVFAAIVGLLVPFYLVAALTQLPRLATAYASASTTIQALGLLLTVLVAGVLAWQAREAWGDVATALRISAARQQVRTAVVASGIPIAIVALFYGVVAGMTNNILLGLVAGVAAGLIAREVLHLLTRARYRVSMLGSSPSTAERVVLEGAMLDPANAPTQAFIRVNGSTKLQHPDQERVADAAATVAAALVEEGDAPPTLPEWHARFVTEFGITDPVETRMKLYERARRIVFKELREHGRQMPRAYLEDKLAELHAPLNQVSRADGVVAAEWKRGYIHLDDEHVTLRRDPYA